MLVPATLVQDGGDAVAQAGAHDHTADNTGHGAGNADGNGALYRLDRNLEPLLMVLRVLGLISTRTRSDDDGQQARAHDGHIEHGHAEDQEEDQGGASM